MDSDGGLSYGTQSLPLCPLPTVFAQGTQLQMELQTLKETFSNFSSSLLMEMLTLSTRGEWVLPQREGLGGLAGQGVGLSPWVCWAPCWVYYMGVFRMLGTGAQTRADNPAGEAGEGFHGCRFLCRRPLEDE